MQSPSPLNPQSGIAVATQNRLIFAAKGMFSKAIDEVPFSNMTAISYRFAPTTAGDILPALITANINDLAHSFSSSPWVSKDRFLAGPNGRLHPRPTGYSDTTHRKVRN